MLAPGCCDVGQRLLAMHGCSYLVPACYCNPSKLSLTKIWKKKKVEIFPS